MALLAPQKHICTCRELPPMQTVRTHFRQRRKENNLMTTQRRILVSGAGGFIGHHLVKRLKADGYWVRGVDLKQPEYESSAADAFESLDLRRFDDCLMATRGGIDEVYNLDATASGHQAVVKAPQI